MPVLLGRTSRTGTKKRPHCPESVAYSRALQPETWHNASQTPRSAAAPNLPLPDSPVPYSVTQLPIPRRDSPAPSWPFAPPAASKSKSTAGSDSAIVGPARRWGGGTVLTAM